MDWLDGIGLILVAGWIIFALGVAYKEMRDRPAKLLKEQHDQQIRQATMYEQGREGAMKYIKHGITDGETLRRLDQIDEKLHLESQEVLRR